MEYLGKPLEIVTIQPVEISAERRALDAWGRLQEGLLILVVDLIPRLPLEPPVHHGLYHEDPR